MLIHRISFGLLVCTVVFINAVHAENMLVHLKNGTVQTYTITQIEKITFNLSGSTMAVQSDAARVFELRKVLERISPNPFRESTTLHYSLMNEANVMITVFDIKGQIVKTLVNDKLRAGSYTARWNGTRDNNLPVASGTYIARISIDDQFVNSRTMNLVK
jgi:hypothetical protein